jgi:hypothetical protein
VAPHFCCASYFGVGNREAASHLNDGAYAVQNPNDQGRVPLQDAARQCGLTGHGLLKLLNRINGAIRHDGHWFVRPETLATIKNARRALGIERAPKERKALQAKLILPLKTAGST